MGASEERIDEVVAQVEALGDLSLPLPEIKERLRAILRGLSEEEREAFFRIADQKRAHMGEKVEFDQERLDRLRSQRGEGE